MKREAFTAPAKAPGVCSNKPTAGTLFLDGDPAICRRHAVEAAPFARAAVLSVGRGAIDGGGRACDRRDQQRLWKIK